MAVPRVRERVGLSVFPIPRGFPTGNCSCFVLQTGESEQQGKMVQRQFFGRRMGDQMSGSSTHRIRFDWVERARQYLKPLAAGAPSAPVGERGAWGIVNARRGAAVWDRE
jgi:hypothetical protein